MAEAHVDRQGKARTVEVTVELGGALIVQLDASPRASGYDRPGLQRSASHNTEGEEVSR
jgi:hypothetical protein